MNRLILCSILLGVALAFPADLVLTEQPPDLDKPSETPAPVVPPEVIVTETSSIAPTTTTTVKTTSQQPIRPAPVTTQRSRVIPQQPVTPPVPRKSEKSIAVNVDDDDEKRLEQARNAHYSFDSEVHDKIQDNMIIRSEKRDGLSVEGMYAYSDGFFTRTIHYAADEKGYRIVKETVEPIGDGPQYDPKGRADVSGSLIGSYSITGDDIGTYSKTEKTPVVDKKVKSEAA